MLDIYDVMFHLVYYAKSFNVSSCLEGVPLEVFQKSCYYSRLSRIVVCTKPGSLFWVLCKIFIFLGCVDPMIRIIDFS